MRHLPTSVQNLAALRRCPLPGWVRVIQNRHKEALPAYTTEN
jgi:hypothetical protein